MQQHHIAGFDPAQIGQHAAEIHAPRAGVEIPVFGQPHPEVADNRRMVGPGRAGQPDGRVRGRIANQFQRLADCPGSAGGGYGGDPVTRNRAIQHQQGHRVSKGRITGKGGVGLGILSFDQPPFGRLDRPHHRRQPGGILVDPDPQVDLVLARVIPERRNQRQDLVGRLVFQALKHFKPPSLSADRHTCPIRTMSRHKGHDQSCRSVPTPATQSLPSPQSRRW